MLTNFQKSAATGRLKNLIIFLEDNDTITDPVFFLCADEHMDENEYAKFKPN